MAQDRSRSEESEHEQLRVPKYISLQRQHRRCKRISWELGRTPNQPVRRRTSRSRYVAYDRHTPLSNNSLAFAKGIPRISTSGLIKLIIKDHIEQLIVVSCSCRESRSLAKDPDSLRISFDSLDQVLKEIAQPILSFSSWTAHTTTSGRNPNRLRHPRHPVVIRIARLFVTVLLAGLSSGLGISAPDLNRPLPSR